MPKPTVWRLIALGAVVLLSLPAAARAEGFVSISSRFYSEFFHVTATFTLLDTTGACVADEYGGYDNLNCYAYDSNDATLDIRVYRKRRYRSPVLVYSDQMPGFSGKAIADVYYRYDLGVPYSCTRQITTYYRFVVRLFDPLTDTVADSTSDTFWIRC